ncbi:MAG: N-acetyltransferase [Proteobacteria bacterium]|nr:N-acetyltransferase [Pseudomonadota bacterium]
MIEIRPARAQDEQEIRAIHDAAFGGPLEGRLVAALNAAKCDMLSLVAEERHRIIGHLLFSPVTVNGATAGMGLAPLAVLPDAQNKGVGSALIRHGLALLDARNCPFIVVLGHPGYYPRFGFEPAIRHGIRPQWPDIPEEAFMIRVRNAEALPKEGGVVEYHPAFSLVT